MTGRRNYGQGSIYQTKKGWMIRHSGTFNGKRRRFTTGPYPTERAAIESTRKRQPAGPRPGLTLKDWLEEWLEARRKELAGKNTGRYTQYNKHLNAFIPAIPHRLAMDDVTPDEIRKIFTTLRQRLSAKYCRNIKSTIHMAMGRAVEAGMIGTNPVTATVRIEGDETTETDTVEILSQADWTRLLTVLTQNAADSRAIGCLIAATTGLRAGEVCGLTWRHIDLNNATISVDQQVKRTGSEPGKRSELIVTKKLKTKTSRRRVSAPQILVDALRAHRAALDVPSLSDHVVLNSSRRFHEPAGLTRWATRRIYEPSMIPDVGLHGLRHTVASHLLNSGMDVVKVSFQLGHSSPTVTLTTYAHVVIASVPEIGLAIQAIIDKPVDDNPDAATGA